MYWYHLLAIVSALICTGSCLIHGIKLIRNGNPNDYSKKIGNQGAAIRYAYTRAMSPMKKESAFMHLPTYTAGIFYHIGTFISLFLFILFIAGIIPTGVIAIILSVILAVSGLSGIGILAKRILKKQLRELSNPDDYISNFMVTMVQILTAVVMMDQSIIPFYFITTSILFLYLPLGKLKHLVYFFAARYHLGLFFGHRGVWPPNQG